MYAHNIDTISDIPIVSKFRINKIKRKNNRPAIFISITSLSIFHISIESNMFQGIVLCIVVKKSSFLGWKNNVLFKRLNTKQRSREENNRIKES